MYASHIPAFAYRSITLHGLRSGCAISLAIAGTKVDAILEHVGWKSPSTVRRCIKLNQVLNPGGAADALSSLK